MHKSSCTLSCIITTAPRYTSLPCFTSRFSTRVPICNTLSAPYKPPTVDPGSDCVVISPVKPEFGDTAVVSLARSQSHCASLSHYSVCLALAVSHCVSLAHYLTVFRTLSTSLVRLPHSQSYCVSLAHDLTVSRSLTISLCQACSLSHCVTVSRCLTAALCLAYQRLTT